MSNSKKLSKIWAFLDKPLLVQRFCVFESEHDWEAIDHGSKRCSKCQELRQL